MTTEPEPYASNGVRGFLHRPAGTPRDGLVLAHGAGSNCNAPLLVSVCRFFAEAGWLALRIDLPFRQLRPSGSPFPAIGVKDREGLRQASDAARALGPTRIVLGGHSYGGRQSTMLAAEDASSADALLLLSYPLHPPSKPHDLRTAHLPNLRSPCLFVHGERDPFGTIEEMRQALEMISAPKRLITVPKAGHELKKPPLDQVLADIESLLLRH